MTMIISLCLTLLLSRVGASPTFSMAGASIASRSELNAAIDTGTNKKMGFLSMANYNSVHTMLSQSVQPMVYTNTQQLYDAVSNGTVIGGMMSGIPDRSKFTVFSTNLVSPRAFQMMPGSESRHLMEAVDAAVVRTHNDGAIGIAEKANPPFEAVEIHTCKSDDVSKVPFPEASVATGLLKNVLDTRKLRILAYGLRDDKPDWHHDGNYKVSPATGFWPDYVRAFMVKFRAAYGQDIQLERVWMKSGGTASVLNGSIHMTEPYYIYENLYSNRVKKWSHDFSCMVLGYEQRFFTLKSLVVTDAGNGTATCSQQLASCVSTMQGSHINSRLKLNQMLDSGTNKKMGFLSMANYNSVHTMLSSSVEPVIYTSTQQLEDAVYNGSLIAGKISGVPDVSKFSLFSTDLMSPRAFQMSPGPDSRHLMEAVDAAVVRTHNDGAIGTVERANPPFQAVEIHTCKSDDLSKVPFPNASVATGLLKNVLDTRKLRMLAFGLPDDKPDWKQDGNYKVSPATGFWPDYVRAFMVKFRAAYGQDIQLERVWMKGGTALVLNGSIHMTEPYYIYENLYNNRVKKWSHDFSCVVMGYEQSFFSKKPALSFDGATCELQLEGCQKAAAGAAATAAAATTPTPTGNGAKNTSSPTTDAALHNTLTIFTTVFVLLMTNAWAS